MSLNGDTQYVDDTEVGRDYEVIILYRTPKIEITECRSFDETEAPWWEVVVAFGSHPDVFNPIKDWVPATADLVDADTDDNNLYFTYEQ